LAATLTAGLHRFGEEVHPLPGLATTDRMESFVEQLLESIHRVQYRSVLLRRDISQRRSEPGDDLFDPLRAAVFHQRKGNTDEAYWCVFLFIYFGKHPRGGWRYAREVYGRLGGGGRWDWTSTSSSPSTFRDWLRDNAPRIRRPGEPGGFGNHRKYESLDADSDRGTGAAVESYVRWIAPPRGHEEFFTTAYEENGRDPEKTFNWLYRSMKAVQSFGRTARFEYLATVGALGLAPIKPDKAYLADSTGPKTGAKLLFTDEANHDLSNRRLEELAVQLGLTLSIGMQELEDAICNWQKSPERFRAFRG
jgi:hypothetical protein